MSETGRAVIDTNLLVRFLTEDDPIKASEVRRLLLKAEEGAVRLLIPSVVIAELVWVLQSFYRLDRSEIVPLLNAIVHTKGVEVGDRPAVSEAIGLYRDATIDFIDALIVAYARQVGVRSVYTFDRKHFKGVEGVEMVHP